MIAARKGYLNILSTLTELRVEVNKVDNRNNTALMKSGRKGHWNIVKKLVTSGADVNKINASRFTALSIIAMRNNVEGVRIMLRSGAKVNLGYTPFNRRLNTKTKKLLIAAGTRINKTITTIYAERASFARHTLQNQCRIAIRQYLLKLDRHGNLFFRIPRIGLPSPITSYLLYDISLDDEDEDDDIDGDDSFGEEPLMFEWCNSV